RRRRRLGTVGRSHQRPGHTNRFPAFPDHRHGRTRGQESEQRFVERLAFVDGVVLLGQLLAGLDQLQTRHTQALLLEALHNGALKPAVDAVGFQQDQRLLHGDSFPFCWTWSSNSPPGPPVVVILPRAAFLSPLRRRGSQPPRGRERKGRGGLVRGRLTERRFPPCREKLRSTGIWGVAAPATPWPPPG